MKVLHVIPSISPTRGGPSKAVIEMVKALRSEGVDASIVTTSDNSSYRDKTLPVEKWFLYETVPVLIFRSLDSSINMLNEYLISTDLTKWLFHNMEKYDIIHIHAIFSYPSTIAMIIARIKQVPYIVRTIGQLDCWSLRQGQIKKQLMIALVERSNLNNAKLIHVTSAREGQDVLRMVDMDTLIKILPLGVETPKRITDNLISNISSSPVIKFIFLSRLHPKKQLEIALKAFHRLRTEYKLDDWCLYIAGDGEEDYVLKMRILADQLQLKNHIRWLGHLSGDIKTELLGSMDWFVLPSASENFGIAAVEALALGVPVIISPAVGIADAVKEHQAGIICETDDQKLALALKTAMGGVPITMRLAAKQLVKERYSWDKISQDLKDLYLSILKP